MGFIKFNQKVISILICALFVLGLVESLSFSQNLGVPADPPVSLEALEKELIQLEKQLPRYTNLKTPLNEREIYTKKVIDLLEKITALKNEEANPNQEQQAEYEGKRLILSEILINDKPSNIAGSQYQQCHPEDCRDKSLIRFNALEIQEYPSVIQVGQSFSFRLKGSSRLKKPEGIYGVSLYNTHGGAARNKAKVFLKIGGIITEVRGLKEMVDAPTKKDGVNESDSVNLFVDFQFQSIKNKTALYKLATLKTNGKEDTHRGGSHLGREVGLELRPEDRHRGLLVFFDGGGAIIKFKYKWGDENDQPLIAEQLDVMDDTTLASDTENTDVTTGQNDVSGLNNSQMTDNSNPQSTTQTNGQNNQTDPSQAISADNPRIQQLITAWINTAEPPKNATIGAELRYGKWAQVHGKTPTGVITLSDKPDAARGYADHFKYLWTVKTEKDSVDHCTLGEYINIKLASQSTAQCKGRYKPLVPNMVGMKVQAAQKLLKERKLLPALKVGAPAPNEAKSLTVIKQSATQGSSLKKQSSVVLSIYSPYVNRKTLGNYVGRRAKEAQTALAQKGFKIKLVLGSSPTNAQQSTKVEAQSPKAGTELKSGSLVTLTVHPGFAPLVVMPGLLNYPVTEAQDKLTAIGLKSTIEQGPPTTIASESHKVIRQSILPGQKVKKGTLVRLRVLGAYTPVVPDVIGMTVTEARKALGEVGNRARLLNGAQTFQAYNIGRVQQQSVRSGTRVRQNGIVDLYIYRDGAKIAAQRRQREEQWLKEQERRRQQAIERERREQIVREASKPAPKSTDCGERTFRGSKCGGIGFMQHLRRSTDHESNRRVHEAWTPSTGGASGITVNKSRQQMSSSKSLGTGDWYVFEVLTTSPAHLRLKRGRQRPTTKWYVKTGPFKSCENARKNALLYYKSGQYSFPNSSGACRADITNTPAKPTTRQRVAPSKPSGAIMGVPTEYWNDKYY